MRRLTVKLRALRSDARTQIAVTSGPRSTALGRTWIRADTLCSERRTVVTTEEEAQSVTQLRASS